MYEEEIEMVKKMRRQVDFMIVVTCVLIVVSVIVACWRWWLVLK